MNVENPSMIYQTLFLIGFIMTTGPKEYASINSDPEHNILDEKDPLQTSSSKGSDTLTDKACSNDIRKCHLEDNMKTKVDCLKCKAKGKCCCEAQEDSSQLGKDSSVFNDEYSSSSSDTDSEISDDYGKTHILLRTVCDCSGSSKEEPDGIDSSESIDELRSEEDSTTCNKIDDSSIQDDDNSTTQAVEICESHE